MPSDPHRELLNRDLSRVSAAQLVAVSDPLLIELVNDGTMVFTRCCVASNDAEEDQHLAALMLYRQLLELIDGTQVLISSACSLAVLPVLRAALEANLQLRFLVSDNALYEQRAWAWLCVSTHNRIAGADRFDPETGLRFHEAWRREDPENTGQEVQVPTRLLEATRAVKSNLQEVLRRPQLTEAHSDYVAKRKKGRYPDWFSLLGGPSNLGELSKRVGEEALYLTLYPSWSQFVHGIDWPRFLFRRAGETHARRIRSPEDLPNATLIAAHLMLSGTAAILEKLRPNEPNRGAWYAREVKELMDRLRDLARAESSGRGASDRPALRDP